jgi:hypothetical protein
VSISLTLTLSSHAFASLGLRATCVRQPFGLRVCIIAQILIIHSLNKDNTPVCSYDGIAVMTSVLRAAFYVVTTPITPANTPNIAFDTIRVNRNSMYNSTTKQISSVSESGIYWLQMASAVPANSTTNMSLNGLTYPAVVYHEQ